MRSLFHPLPMKPALPNPDAGRRPPPPKAPPPQAVQTGESPSEKRRVVLLLVAAVVIGAMVEFRAEIRQRADAAIQTLQARDDVTPAPAPAPAPVGAAPDAAGQPPDPAADVSAAQAAIERITPVVSVLTGGPLREVAGMSREAMQVSLTPTGDVLMTGKYAVLQLGAGDAPFRRLLFDPRRYREHFADARAQASASALLLADGRYLIGGWHGEVLLGEDTVLQRLSSRDVRPQGRIARLIEWHGHVLVAGDGLWRMDATAQTLEEIALPGVGRIRAVGVGAQVLLLADAGRIVAWDGQGAAPWLQWPDDAGRVEVLVPARAGGWWVGTTRGLFRIDAAARQPQAVLRDVWVTDVVERSDEVWVGTWKQGLLLARDGNWYRLGAGLGGLKDDSVSALTIDAQEHLWLALYGGGGWRADLPALRAQILQRPWSPSADPQR